MRRVLVMIEREVGYRLSVLRGIFRYAREGESWICQGCDANPRAVTAVRDWKPDGVIVALYDRQLGKSLVRYKSLPVVDVFDWHRQFAYPRVTPDDRAVGAKAATYFIERRFTRLAFLGHPELRFSLERRDGFLETAAASGVPVIVAPATCGSGEIWATSRRTAPHQALLNWVSSLPKPVAVFCASDGWGAQLIEACHTLKISVPDDVAVLGADNDELLCQLGQPPMSSVDLCAERVGYRAARMLDALMNGDNAGPTRVALPPGEVVERQSTNVLCVNDPDIATALRFIHANAHRTLRIDDLCEHVVVPRRTLQRRFREAVGHGIMQEIMRCRLDRARRLLSETDLPIPEVARRSGFSSRERFWSIFHKREKCPPLEFRRLARTPDW
jgi:LacI family transcriptional regulator